MLPLCVESECVQRNTDKESNNQNNLKQMFLHLALGFVLGCKLFQGSDVP